MKKVIILGGGNMGTYIASNLVKDYSVGVVDYNQKSLDKIKNEKIIKKQADLSNTKIISSLIKDSDIVISALPEFFGYEALVEIIKAGKDVVDISFWDQNKERLEALNLLAKENGVKSFIDCGIAPGFGSAIVAHFDNLLKGKTKNVEIYVGGIPSDSKRKFFAPWSISGLIEEYQRPALRVLKGIPGKIPSLSIRKNLTLKDLNVEAAITDGLRSIAFSMGYISNMAEFTLRYPGHFDQMVSLRKVGYFDEELVDVGKNFFSAYDLSKILLEKLDLKKEDYKFNLQELGFYDEETKYESKKGKISPREIAIKVLSKKWEAKPEDKDILIMRVQADDGLIRCVSDICAESDGINSAMALTTGGMASLATRYLLEKPFNEFGVFPLEQAVKIEPKLISYFSKGLENLGVEITQEKLDVSKS